MSGLRFELGRDMPPGMQEKLAVQITQQLTEAGSVAESTTMAFICARCGAPTDNSEEIATVVVHFCDACNDRISREVQ